MANSNKLKRVAAKFRKENPGLHTVLSAILDYMGYTIKKTGAPEVVAGIDNNKKLYCYASK